LLIEINETPSSPLLQREDEVSFDQFIFHHQPAGNAAAASTSDMNSRRLMAIRPPKSSGNREKEESRQRGDSIKIKIPVVSG